MVLFAVVNKARRLSSGPCFFFGKATQGQEAMMVGRWSEKGSKTRGLIVRSGLVWRGLIGFLSMFFSVIILSQENPALPELVDFDFRTQAMDIGCNPAHVAVTAHVEDLLGGVRFIDMYSRSPSGSYRTAEFSLKSGMAQNGFWEGLDGFYSSFELGQWCGSCMRIFDVAGNVKGYLNADVGNLGFQTEVEVLDVDPTPLMIRGCPGDVVVDNDPGSCGALDTEPPADPEVTSPSHTVGVWSSDPDVEIRVTGASDNCGVDGFEYAWDQNPSWTPSHTKMVEETWTGGTFTATASGDWYFHLATVDNAGNWTGTVNEHSAVLPARSVAVQVTTVVPTGNVLPEGGSQPTLPTPTLSVAAGAAQVTTALHWPGSLP